MVDVLLVLFYIVIPAILLVLRSRVGIIKKLGAVTVAYIIGVIVGNIGVLPLENVVANELMGPVVILSIPLLLFGTDLTVFRTSGRNMTTAFLCCILAVIVASTSSAFVFGQWIEEISVYSAMAFGVYTGGTVNLSAIGLALGAPSEAIVLISAADLAWGGLLLLLILTVAKRVLVRILPAPPSHSITSASIESGFDESFQLKGGILGLLLAVVVAGVTAGISFLLTGHLSELVMYVGVTALGLGCALIKPVRQMKGTYALGNYLLIVFCLAIGSLARIENIIDAGVSIMSFIGYIVVVSVVLHILLGRIFKVDADSIILTSTAGLYGPPFIAPVARAIKADHLVPVGITLSLIGFAIGNYGGLLLGHVLKALLS